MLLMVSTLLNFYKPDMQFSNSGNRYDCASLAVLSGRFSLKYLADILFSFNLKYTQTLKCTHHGGNIL